MPGGASCASAASGHSSLGWAPLLGALPLCVYWDRNSAAFKGQIYHLLKHFERVVLATYWGSHLPSGGRVQELTVLSKMMWCYFSLGSKASWKVRKGNTRKRENRNVSFFKAAAPTATAAVAVKAVIATRCLSFASREERVVWLSCNASSSQKPSFSLPPSSLTPLLLVSPSFFKKNRVGDKTVAVLAVLLAPFHTYNFCLAPFHYWVGISRGGERTSVFQGRKIGWISFFHMA